MNPSHRPRRSRSLTGAILSCLLAATAVGAEPDREFDIPAQRAREAVKLLAQQSGLQIAALAEELGEARTNTVRGRYEPMEALTLMLAGTELQAERTGVDTVAIRRRVAALGASATGAEATPATIQVEEITVTGTRIKRSEFDTLQATLTTDSALMQQRGYTSVAEALNETPGFSPSSTNPLGGNQGSFAAGQSFVNLFGLGSQRTLTLLNGRRHVSANTVAGGGTIENPGSQVDLNTIPVQLIDRVETIAIGGAPVYGSDAIAGTVNVILKRDFEGISTDLQYGNSEEGDTEGYTARALIGSNFAEARGNVVLSLGYNKQDGIVLGERYGLRSLRRNPNAPPALTVFDHLVISGMSEGGLPFNPATFGPITSPSGTALQFGSNGELAPFIPGADADGSPFDVLSNGGDGVNFADHASLLSPTERMLVNTMAHYELTSAMRVFMEASYAHTEGSELSELFIFASPFVNGLAIPFSVDNPFLSQQARDILIANGATDFFLARNFNDLLDRGDGQSTSQFDQYRGVIGVEGDFEAFGEQLTWDLAYNYGRSRGVSKSHYINDERFQNALNAVRDGSGNIVCASGGSCVPINLFGVNAFSDAAADYVLDLGKAISQNTQRVVTANLSGSLPFSIGAAQRVSFNIGYEHRREDGSFEPNEVLQNGAIFFGVTQLGGHVRTAGSFKTDEFYGEVLTPLISAEQNVPGVKSLSLEAAARYVDNSLAGGDTTWSAGGRFTPRLPGWAEGLSFRGVFTHAIRSPAITELFSSRIPTANAISDPCDATQYQSGFAPEIRAANCTAALAALGLSPATFDATTDVFSPAGFISGNRDLENETADSWSVGVVYQSQAFPRFRAAADWSDIRLKNGIETLSLAALLSACYDNPDFPNVAACDRFQRLAAPDGVRITGDIADGFESGYINTASLRFAGLIVSAEYDLGRLLAGSWRVATKLFYRDKLEQVISAAQPVEELVGDSPYPEYSGQFNVFYDGNRLNVLLQALWTDSLKIDSTADSTQIAERFNSIDAYWKLNGTVGFDFTDHISAQLSVSNLLDTKPDDAQLLSGNYGVYDVLGRTYVARVTTTF